MEKMMEMDDELKELKREQEHFESVVEDAKRHFGQWDMCDPVVWAILRVVQAQNDFAHAMDQVAAYGVNERVRRAKLGDRNIVVVATGRVKSGRPCR